MGRKRIAAERQRAAKPCAAALVLQGTQPRSIAQAPNFSNACNHATRRAGAGCVCRGRGGGWGGWYDCCGVTPSVLKLWLAEWRWTSLTGHRHLDPDHWHTSRLRWTAGAEWCCGTLRPAQACFKISLLNKCKIRALHVEALRANKTIWAFFFF